MKSFEIWYEVRKNGAIGAFDWYGGCVDAENAQAAADRVFKRWHASGFETRGGPRIKELPLEDDRGPDDFPSMG